MDSASLDTQKAVELIAKSDHVAILLPEHPGIDAYACAEVIARAMEDTGKAAAVLFSGRTGHTPPLIFRKIVNPAPLTREFIISVDDAANTISQLRYEKHDGRVDIILSPKSSPIRQEFFSYRDGTIQCDCIIALGIGDIENIEGRADLDPRLITETPIIAIDISSDNKRYAEASIIATDKSSLAETVHEFLGSLNGNGLGSEEATLLLAGIMAGTDAFSSRMVTESTMRSGAALLARGASWADARDIARSEEPLPLLQLASRAAVRSKEDTEKRILWSFLTTEDFEKTGRGTPDTSFVLQHLSLLFPSYRARALLWQDPQEKNVRATLSAPTPLLEQIAAQEPGAFQSPYLCLTALFANFQEAEERIASLFNSAH